MSVDSAEFKRILGHWVTGVSVVTCMPEGEMAFGMTASAFCSVSLRPPLVLVCVEKDADSHGAIARADHFAINVLTKDQERFARRFAESDLTQKFTGIAFHVEATGSPILDDALAWLDCRVWNTYEAGDHTIYVGEVLAGDARDMSPLLYYRSGYGRFMPDPPSER
jgi:flavin reductase (DIM6/NTAB) family NADH-FMN oxidoreductase RutF